MDLDLALRFSPTGIASAPPRRTTPEVREHLKRLVDVVLRGEAVLLPAPPGTTTAPGAPRILKRREVQAIPALSLIEAHLPRGFGLVVAVWADNTAVIAAAPRSAGGPPPLWLDGAYQAAQKQASEVLFEIGRKQVKNGA